jgi:plastocyanin
MTDGRVVGQRSLAALIAEFRCASNAGRNVAEIRSVLSANEDHDRILCFWRKLDQHLSLRIVYVPLCHIVPLRIFRDFRGGEMKIGLTSLWMIILAAAALQPMAHAQWKATVGTQTTGKGRQVLAFFPNEIWIHAGDSITWTFAADEIHTVTFLTASQPRPSRLVGCPGVTPSGSSFDGTTCVNTGQFVAGQTYTVLFPTPGNFKLVCLVHTDMEGVIHVLDASQPLPHDQDFYDDEVATQRIQLLTDADSAVKHHISHDHDSMERHAVAAGLGEIAATPGGPSTISIMRFMQPNITVHVGTTVEWSNSDPATNHTITFGTEPANLIPPSSNVTLDPDGARHATISSTSDIVHSGFIGAAPQDRIGLPQTPPSVTRFRVTFTQAGVFPYICALHDNLGMVGKVTVVP